jgi:antitoxin component YwqK of YwqJK toxin-antitoxin module
MKIKHSLLLLIISTLILTTDLLAQSPPPARTWYYNYGNKTSVKERWNEDAQGLKHGTYIKYFEDGEREILANYVHGKKNGQEILTTYSTLMFQQVKAITYANFQNDILNGSYKVLLNDELILTSGNYSNQVKVGYWKDDYSLEEKIYSEGNYIDGKRDGEWKNTLERKKSKDEMGFGILLGNTNSNSVETKKGYRTIYKNGNVIAIYDDQGVNVIEKQKQDELNKQIQGDYNNSQTISELENFRAKYPNSKYDFDALNKINELKKQEIEKQDEGAYINPLLDKWNSMTFKDKNPTFFDEYFKKFPKQYYGSIVKEKLYEYKKQLIEITGLKNTLNNCKYLGDGVLCVYTLVNSPISEEAKTELKTYTNKIKIDPNGRKTEGELPFGFAVAMELKDKFGINIFQCLNYQNGWNLSYQLINNYPNGQFDKSCNSMENSFIAECKILYVVENNKLVKIHISRHSSDLTYNYNFIFKDGILHKFTFGGTGKVIDDFIVFDSNGNITKMWTESGTYNADMFPK